MKSIIYHKILVSFLGILLLFLSLDGKSQQCVYSVSSPSMSFTSDGGSQSTSVTKNGSCTYSLSTNASWLTAYKNFGDNVIVVTTTPNTGGTRTGSVYIDGGGVAITVTQSCPAPGSAGSISGNSSLCVGSSGTYSINSVSGATSYTWTASNATISSGQGTTSVNVNFPTSGNATLSVVPNNSCASGGSSALTVNVFSSPSASISGGNTPICYNSNAGTLTATGSGGTGSYTYLWYKNGSSTGVTAQTYSPGNLTSTSTFYCAITSGSCGTANTPTKTLTVYGDLSASIGGGASPICYNTDPGSLTAYGSGGTGSYTYLWYKNGSSTGSTSQTYSPGNLTATSTFYCAVTSGSCGTVNAPSSTITVLNNFSASISGGNTPICYNADAGTLIATGSGGTGFYSYLWYKNGFSTGVTAQTYSPGSLTSTSTFYCAITSGPCGTQNSGSKTITVLNSVSASISGGNTPICYNSNAGTLTATGSGGTGSYTYLWYKNGSSTGVTAQTYSPGNLTSTSTFYCAITSGSCGTANTPTKTLTVYGDLSASIGGGSSSICYNTDPGTLTAYGSGGTGSYTYLWYKNGLSTGSTSQTYSPGNLTATSTFYCAVTSGSCGTVNAPTKTITVFNGFSAGISGGNTSICYNGDAGTLTATGSGGTGFYTYLWYKNDSPTGVTSQTYSPGGLTSTSTFYCAVTNGPCGTVYTTNVQVVVNSIPSITSESLYGQTRNLGVAFSPISINASGIGLTYQWYQNTGAINSGGTPISGATGSSYTPSSSVPGILYYYCVVTGTCGTTVSSVSGAFVVNDLSVNCSTVNVDYNTGPVSCFITATANLSWTASVESNGNGWLTVTPVSGSGGSAITINCTNNSLFTSRTGTITIYGSGITKTITVVQQANIPPSPPVPNVSNECQQSVLSFNGTPPAGLTWYWQSSSSGTSTTNAISPYTVASAGTYYLRARSSEGIWGPSSSVSANPYTNPTQAIAGATQNLNCTLLSNALGCNDPLIGTGHWSIASGGTGVFSNPSGGNSTFTADSFGTYKLDWSISNGSCATSTAQVTVVFSQNITTATVGLPQNLCGTLVSDLLGGNTPTNGTGAWSIVSGGTGSFSAPGSGNSTFTANSTGTYVLRWTISNGACTPSSADVSIAFKTVSTAPTSITSDLNHVCPSEFFLLTVNGGSLGTGAQWKWYDNTAMTTSIGTGSSLNTSCLESTTYYIRAEGDCNTTSAVSLAIVVDKINAGKIFFADSVSYKPIINKTITSQVNATAGHCGFSYSWEKAIAPKVKTDPLGWTAIASQTGSTLLISNLDVSTYFRRIAKDLTNHAAYSNAIQIQIKDDVAVPPSNLLTNGAVLTVHKGRHGLNGKWAWYTDFKGQPLALTTDSAKSFSVSKPTKVRVRGEYKVKNAAGDSISMKTYFISEKIPYNESINLPSNQNYIVSYTPTSPNGVDENGLASLPLEEQGAVIQYFDGLGRPTQTVAANQSYFFNDVVTGMGYDSFGRQDKTYIPSTNHGKGNAVGDIGSNISAFYSGITGTAVDGIEPLSGGMFTQTGYEASPLNRVTSVTDPKGGTTQYAYGTNSAGEVPLCTINESGLLSKNGTYGAGQLYTTQTTDPVGNTVKEYKDKQGQVVLKVAADAKTYYVYDDLGLLRYVISPLASAGLNDGTYTPNTDIIKGLCYYYQYDGRKRMVKKQLPGADEVLMVYDTRDRLVLTQDGKTRGENSQKWLYAKYDTFNRPTETGWLTATQNHADLQTAFGATTDFPASCSFTQMLTQTYYDSYIGSPSGVTPNPDVKGQITRTVAKKLDFTGDVTTDMFYDNKYRVIQTQVSGGPINQTTTNTYDFVGKLLTSVDTYSGQVVQTINKYFTYDHAGRLEKVEQQIVGDTHNGKVVLAQNDYNDLGQLMLKKLHMSRDTSYVQDIDYQYDVRGWLKSINNMTDTTFRKLYAQDLSYLNNGNINSLMWKNTQLRTDGWIKPSNKQKYDFTYDGLSRMDNAVYSETDPANQLVSSKSGFFDEDPSYDINGNITGLIRYGNASTSGFTKVALDNLIYTYSPNSNKILSMSDSGVGASHNKEFKPVAGTYTYDTNGNDIYIPHKQSTVTYNYLNLPNSVAIAGQGTITYLYDAAGNKLQKTFGGVDSYYQGNVLSINGSNIVLTGEGRAVFNSTKWDYEYDLRDHLGNTRVSFSADTASIGALQYKDYYPFGMEMVNNILSKPDATKFLYNGKELQDEGGLDMYDYGARFYDPTIGRFHSVDPMAVFTPGISPYAYAADNPVLYIDEYGLGWVGDVLRRVKDVVLRGVGFTRHGSLATSTHGRRANNVYYSWDNKSSSSSSSGNSSTTNTSPSITRNSINLDPLTSLSGLIPNEFNPTLAPSRPSIPESNIIIPQAGQKTHFSGDVKFKPNSDNFYSIETTDEVLGELVNTLQDATNLRVLIIGNTGTDSHDPSDIYGNSTDALSQPATINGRQGTTRDLMNARARAVYKYLIDHGISPDRLKYGPGTRYSNASGRKTSFILSNP